MKDLPDGAETQMKQKHTAAVLRAEEKFAAAKVQYQIDLEKTKEKADVASLLISKAYKDNAYAITSLVVSIVGIVGALIAAAITTAATLSFIAIPFGVALIPSIIMTCCTSDEVSRLEKDINGPDNLAIPKLYHPIYYKEKDLDLKSSRAEVQDQLATASLSTLAESSWMKDALLVDYGLLDRVAPADGQKRSDFYAKFFQLISAQEQIAEERRSYRSQINTQFYHLDEERRVWHHQREDVINEDTYNLWQRDSYYRRKENEKKIVNQVFTPTRSQADDMRQIKQGLDWLERFKHETKVKNDEWERRNRHWKESAYEVVEVAFRRAQAQLEQQYAIAKLGVLKA